MVFIAIGMAQAAKVARQKYVQNKKRQEVIVPVEGSNQLMANRAGASGADTWFGGLNDNQASSSRSSSQTPQQESGQPSSTNPLNPSSKPSSAYSSTSAPFGSSTASDRDSHIDVVNMDDPVTRADTNPRVTVTGSSRVDSGRRETKTDVGSFPDRKGKKDRIDGKKKNPDTVVAGSFSAAMRQERQKGGEQGKRSVRRETSAKAESGQSGVSGQLETTRNQAQRKPKGKNAAPGSFAEERERSSRRPGQRGAIETTNPVVGGDRSKDIEKETTRSGNDVEGSFAEMIKRNSGNRTKRDRKNRPVVSAYPAGSKVRPTRAARVAQEPTADSAEVVQQQTGSCMQAAGTMKKRVTRKK